MRKLRTQRDLASDAFNATHQPLLEFFWDPRGLTIGIVLVSAAGGHDGSKLWAGEEVDQVHHTIFMDVASLEDGRRWQILLLCSACGGTRGSDTEMATLVFVKEATENGRRIEIRPACNLTEHTFHRKHEMGLIQG